MAKSFLLFTSLCLVAANLFSQGPAAGEETIRWIANKKLAWSDYKGIPDPSSDAAASTTTYLGIDYKMTDRDFNYKITCTFSKNRSWGRHRNEHILQHEQGHFDIAEIYARKLHQQMKAYQYDATNYRTELRRIYKGILDEKESMQNNYDQETNHSINKEKQAEWLLKINSLLDETLAFANY